MRRHQIRKLSGEKYNLPDDLIQQFSQPLRGKLIEPDTPEYEEASKIYNAMIDRHPGMIVQCEDVADVVATVNFARENDLLLAVRGGGHNGPGLGTCEGGVVCDLSKMNGIYVDPRKRTALVQAGCQSGAVDHATHAYGMATVSGIISTTGIAGLTLGGGHGYLSRKYGLTIDNLLEAQVVLADGRIVTANEDENADLFWALRGGGGNFGIVTSFLFRLHPVAMVQAGPTFFPLEQSGEVLRAFSDFITDAPRDVYSFLAFLSVPPSDPFPKEIQNKQVCGLISCYLGSADDIEEELLGPISEMGDPLFQHVGAMPYPALQSFHDQFYPPGLHWYWKGDFFEEVTDDAIDAHVEYGTNLPTPLSSMHLYPIDGAVHDVGPNETAFNHREANFSQVIVGVSPNPADKAKLIDWTRKYYKATHPHSSGGAYVNFMMQEGQGRIRDTYGDNYDRLTEVKAKYDPKNLFRVNQNIEPARR